MNRRHFLGFVAAGCVAATPKRRIAITMDDFNWQSIPTLSGAEANRAILGHLKIAKVKAALFACGHNIDGDEGRALLTKWKMEGHLIGNHTYSHKGLSGAATTCEFFEEELLRTERLLTPFAGTSKYFRFPFLDEGKTAEKRDCARRILSARGYRNGHVTIDASDWYYDSRLRQRLKDNPRFDTAAYRQPYLDHLWDRATYYDQLSEAVLGRSVPHTVLVHFNLINALFLGDALAMFQKRGWQPVNAEVAYRDLVFEHSPNTLPAGQSLIWALAKESGKYEGKLRFPGEDGDYEKEKLDRLGL